MDNKRQNNFQYTNEIDNNEGQKSNIEGNIDLSNQRGENFEIYQNTIQETKDLDNEKKSRKAEFIQFAKFLAFSLSAGFIQIISFELFYTWTKCLAWWPAYLISIILSVIWNFTFNRKFTFKSASNVPLAMTLVIIYYCAFIPLSVFGGGALEKIGWNGTLVTLLMMVINFLTEFFWDKYIVFNDKLLHRVFKVKEKNKVNEESKDKDSFN